MQGPFIGGERSPSLGQWPAEAYDEERKLGLRQRPVHKPGEYERASEIEDRMIDLIDNGPDIREDDIGGPPSYAVAEEGEEWSNLLQSTEEDEAREAEQNERARIYAEQQELRAAGVLPTKSEDTAKINTSSREQLTPKELNQKHINKFGRLVDRSRKRNPSQARINLDASIKQLRKGSNRDRISV
jgi:hypothetical protein